MAMRVSFDPAYDDRAVLDAVAALRAGDRRPAAALLRETGDDWDRKAHRVNRLAHDEDCHRTIAEWVAAEPGSADAHMVNARALVVQGWAIRGSAYARYVRESAWSDFFDRLHAADAALSAAMARAPQDPTPWGIAVLLARGLQVPRTEFERRWDGLVQRDPAHVTGHYHALQYLCAKWSGSHDEMFGFADRASAAAPPGSPLHALSLFAVIEYAMALTDGQEAGQTEALFWKGFQAAQAVDRAVDLWEKPAAEKGTPPHARAVFDRMHLAFCASRIGSGAVAARQFRAMGPYCSDMPWNSFVILPRFRTRVHRRLTLAFHRRP
jgi:hypothetical protein